MNIQKIVVAGGGVLGSQIAFQSAYCGFDVTVWLRSDASIGRSQPKIDRLHQIYLAELAEAKNQIGSSHASFSRGLIADPEKLTPDKIAELETGEEKNKKYDLFEKTDGIDDDSFSSLSEDIYLYNSVSKRLLREDVYSIVDSCFVPYGIECEIYSVLGNILRVESYKNYYTDELIYDLTLECNDILLHVGINKRDLEGEPLAGRRFRGVIWLQGRIEFEEDKI